MEEGSVIKPRPLRSCVPVCSGLRGSRRRGLKEEQKEEVTQAPRSITSQLTLDYTGLHLSKRTVAAVNELTPDSTRLTQRKRGTNAIFKNNNNNNERFRFGTTCSYVLNAGLISPEDRGGRGGGGGGGGGSGSKP